MASVDLGRAWSHPAFLLRCAVNGRLLKISRARNSNPLSGIGCGLSRLWSVFMDTPEKWVEECIRSLAR